MRPIVVGFHGCDRKIAMEVVTGQARLRWSRNDHDWLGNGTYYWEDDPRIALAWAKECARRGTHDISEPAVLGAAIDLTDSLNLVQTEAYSLVRAAYDVLKNTCKSAGRPLPRNGGVRNGARYLDCAVFETLHLLRESEHKAPFSSVRAFFPEGTAVFPGAGIRKRDHIQICVRESRRILGHFLADL